jgi:hypothetical protein
MADGLLMTPLISYFGLPGQDCQDASERRLIPLTQVRLYVVGLGCGDERPFCEDCLA